NVGRKKRTRHSPRWSRIGQNDIPPRCGERVRQRLAGGSQSETSNLLSSGGLESVRGGIASPVAESLHSTPFHRRLTGGYRQWACHTFRRRTRRAQPPSRTRPAQEQTNSRYTTGSSAQDPVHCSGFGNVPLQCSGGDRQAGRLWSLSA